ncbi:MAG: hypothetical protein CMP48_24500 [Rickettsiales bacterium]|nr:hypothetical protein [Rickettsiales bacterium]
MLSRAQIAFYDAQKLAALSSDQIDLVLKYSEEHEKHLDNQKKSFENSIETAKKKNANAIATQKLLMLSIDDLERKIQEAKNKAQSDAVRNQILRLRSDLNRIYDQLRQADADIRASDSRITQAQLSIVELDKRQSLISKVGLNGQPSEKEVLDNLKKFLDDPFDNSVNKLEFDLIYSILDRVFKEINKKSELEKANSIAAPLLGVLPTAISAFNSKTGPSENDVIKELSFYIADEFRKGVTASYVKFFEKKLDSIGELQLLFPTTYDMLKERNPFTYPDLGKEWKVTIEEDLRKLLPNLIEFMEMPNGDLKMKFLTDTRINTVKNKPVYNYLVLSTDIISKLVDKYHPSDLFAYLDAKYYESDYKIGKIEKVIHGIEIIQSNLRDTTKSKANQFSNIWISPEQFKLLNNDRKLHLFAGLIYQQDKEFFEPMKAAIHESGTFSIEKLKAFQKQHLIPILDVLNKIKEYESSLQSKEEYTVYLELFVDLFKVVSTHFAVDTHLEEINKAADLIANHKTILKKDFDQLVTKISDEDYVKALLDIIDNEFLKEKVDLFKERMTDSELFNHLSKPEITKLSQAEIGRLTGSLEDKIKQLSLTKNCKITIAEIELIRNSQSYSSIKAEVLKYKELINLSDAEVLLLEYKEDATDILKLFEDNKLSGKEWNLLLTKVNNRIDDEWLESLDHVLHIYQAIKEKNNENLLTHLLLLLEKVIGDELEDRFPTASARIATIEGEIKILADTLKKTHVRFNQDSLAQRLIVLNEELKELEGFKHYQNTINLIRKFMPFVIALSDTDDPEAMKKVIKEHVAPANSFAKKRVSPFFATITAHPGLFLSYETLKLNDESAMTVGMTGPIGLEIGKRLNCKKCSPPGTPTKFVNKNNKLKKVSGHSISLYGQLVDIGAILNYRISDDSAEDLPSEVSFKQIWSPGVSLNWGIRNTPLTLGIGWQSVPELREIKIDNDDNPTNVGDISQASRYFLRLSWDIPLVNIYTSAK